MAMLRERVSAARLRTAYSQAALRAVAIQFYGMNRALRLISGSNIVGDWTGQPFVDIFEP